MAAAEDVAMGIAETLQTAHINQQPDPAYDVNPSTAASKKVPVRPSRSQPPGDSRGSSPRGSMHVSDEIPVDLVDRQPRKQNLPPLPDLRFEQSYLARIKPYSDAGDYKMVAFYTVWDNVVMPLSQGLIWRLAVFGWRSFNTGTQFHGRGVGARLRRWWWTVNGWELPQRAGAVKSQQVEEFVVSQFGSGGSD